MVYLLQRSASKPGGGLPGFSDFLDMVGDDTGEGDFVGVVAGLAAGLGLLAAGLVLLAAGLAVLVAAVLARDLRLRVLGV